MAHLIFITHPEVTIDPVRPVTDWSLSPAGRARAAAFAASGTLAAVTAIWSSAERKARDAAHILAAPLGLPVSIRPALGEIDRSATGFLPPDEFERTADAFFARPSDSIRGWERAADAQARIETAVRHIAGTHKTGDLAIVSHGAVGTLLYCALAGHAIDRRHDQPHQGHFWTADLPDLVPQHPWKPLD
ncbi:MAG: histidine phosphatase family protein [Silicimonas sp.]|nr:histidine phosphatase family protein [Silicimonas sp.]